MVGIKESKLKKCETGRYKDGDWKECGKKAKFQIVDIVCKPIEKPFWICVECLPYFIPLNLEEPHYVVVEILK